MATKCVTVTYAKKALDGGLNITDALGQDSLKKWHRPRVAESADANPECAVHWPPVRFVGSESITMPDPFSVLSKRDLITLLRRRECRFDDVNLEQLRLATLTYLESWRSRARESKSVLEASDFARWVLSSGLAKLFRDKGAAEVEKVRKDVLWACECAWKNQGGGGSVALSEVEAINAKLDGLSAAVAELARSKEPVLKVV